VPRARTQVQALLGDKITLYPTDDGYLEAEVVGDYAGLMTLAAKSPGAMAGASEISVVAGARNQLYLLFTSHGLSQRFQ
jgi:hypothetical protein